MASTEHLIKITLRLQDEMSKEISKSSNGLTELGKNMQKVGAMMTTAFTLPILAIGTASVKMAMDLDASMRNIQAVSKITDEQMKSLSQTFVKMSMDSTMTTDTANNLAKAYYDIVGSGFAAKDAMKVLEVSTKAATAGLTDTQTAAKAVTQVLNTYKLSVDQASFISDVMFQTVNLGVGTFEELAGALSHVTGMANAVGVPFHEVAAALSVMSRNGIDFNEGATALNMAFTSLLNPTEELQKAVKTLGYDTAESMLDTLGFAETINQLRKYAGDSESTLTAMFGSIRGGKAILALTGQNAAIFADEIDKMNASGGATAAAFAIQMQSFQAQWQIFMNTLGAAAIKIGNIVLPILADLLTNYLIPLVKWFIDLDENTTNWVLGLTTLLAVAGPVISVIGTINVALGAFVTAFPAIIAGLSGVGAALAAFLTPAGLFVAAFALIAAALIFNWGGIRDAFASGITAIADAWYKLPGIIAGVGKMIMDGWGNIFQHLSETISQLVVIAMATTGKFFEVFFGIGQNVINGIIKGIAVNIVKFIAMVEKMANDAAQAVRNAFGIHSPSKVMEGIGKNVVAGFHKGIEGMGGIGVNVQAGGNRSQPSLSYAGASAGGGNITQNFYITSQGTSEEQIKHITKEVSKNIGKDAKRRGAKIL